MNVSSSWPSAKAWSPTGYTIVESTPPDSAPAQNPPAVPAFFAPSPPLCKVRMLSEEKTAPRPAAVVMTDVSEPRKTKKKTRRASPASLPVFFIVAVIPFAAIGFGLVAAYAINSSVQRVQHAVLAEPNGRPWANVVVPPALQKNGDDEEPAADIEPAPNKEQAPVLAEPVLAAPPMGPMNPAPNVAAAHDGNPWATTPVRPGCERFGTMVDFDRNPSEAMLRAKKNRTLVMILHVSGNFEDDAFT